MEKFIENNVAHVTRFIQTTPKALREAADRIELLATGMALAKEMVYLEAVQGITLVYNPEITLQQSERKMVNKPSFVQIAEELTAIEGTV